MSTVIEARGTTSRDRTEALAPLVTAAVAGSDSAWSALYAQFTPLLRAVALRFRMGEADTEEAVQATWVKCFECLGGVREPEALPGWLVTTCRREALALRRRKARCTTMPDESLMVLSAAEAAETGRTLDPADLVVDVELVSRLYAAVAGLPDRQRLVIRALLRTGGDGYAEVATVLEMPVGSVGPTRLRALARLRESLDQLAA